MTIDIAAIRAQTVDDFNSLYGVGTWVRYWTGTRQDPAKDGQTRSKAELLGGHTPVVWVTGHGACIALTHVDAIPDQPDGIEDDTHDLPDPARAAERVREYIASNGDGIYDVIDGNPLYARDLEALRRAGEEIGQLRAELAKVRTDRDEEAALAAQLRAEREHMELNPTGTVEWLKNRVNELTAERDQLTAYNRAVKGANDDLRAELAKKAGA